MTIFLILLVVFMHTNCESLKSQIYQRKIEDKTEISVFSSINEVDIQKAKDLIIAFINPCNESNNYNDVLIIKNLSCNSFHPYNDDMHFKQCIDNTKNKEHIFITQISVIEEKCLCDHQCSDKLFIVRQPDCICPSKILNKNFENNERFCFNRTNCFWTSQGFESIVLQTQFDLQMYMTAKITNMTKGEVQITSPYYLTTSKKCSLSAFYWIKGNEDVFLMIELIKLKPNLSEYEFIKNITRLDKKGNKFRWIVVDIEQINGPTAVNFRVYHNHQNTEIKISNITWNNCNDILMKKEQIKCSGLLNPFLCLINSHTVCMEDIQCDGLNDCPDGSDEKFCDQTIPYRCNFDNGSICSNWVVDIHSKSMLYRNNSTSFKIIDTFDATTSVIEREKNTPNTKGKFLLFSPKLLNDMNINNEISYLRTPRYPSNSNEKYCTVRFDYCTTEETYDFSLYLRNEKNQTKRLWNVPHIFQHSKGCLWKKAVVIVGNQPSPYYLEFQARYHKQQHLHYIALDNFSSSPHCFEGQLSTLHSVILVLIKYLTCIVLFLIVLMSLRRYYTSGKLYWIRKITQIIRSPLFTFQKKEQYPFVDLTELNTPTSRSLTRLPNDELLKKLPALVRSSILLTCIIGHGAFGEVFKAELTRNGKKLEVAVKVLNQGLMKTEIAKREFIMEAVLMRSSNTAADATIQVIGASFDVVPHMIVMELMAGGNLLQFLRSCRSNENERNPQNITTKTLTKFALDVAEGCAIIEKLRYVHRDLAARNCLLTTLGPDMRVKVGDFGLAEELYSCYYSMEGVRAKTVLPVKWMPPEAIQDGFFCSKTDVWSFGVVLWEIFSLGTVPYPTESIQSVVRLLRRGERLGAPIGTPMSIYKMMRECWATYPEQRPPFAILHKTLQELLISAEIVNSDLFTEMEKPGQNLWDLENTTSAPTENLYQKICKPYYGMTAEQKKLFLESDFAFWTNEAYMPSSVSESSTAARELWQSEPRENTNGDTAPLIQK